MVFDYRSLVDEGAGENVSVSRRDVLKQGAAALVGGAAALAREALQASADRSSISTVVVFES